MIIIAPDRVWEQQNKSASLHRSLIMRSVSVTRVMIRRLRAFYVRKLKQNKITKTLRTRLMRDALFRCLFLTWPAHLDDAKYQ